MTVLVAFPGAHTGPPLLLRLFVPLSLSPSIPLPSDL